jgi:hypothetical protein
MVLRSGKHLSILAFSALLALQGCRSTSDRLAMFRDEDDFGLGGRDLDAETVQMSDMLRQRAFIDLKAGLLLPFDVFQPSDDLQTGEALALGTKFGFEAFKNLYFHIAFDYAKQNVDAPADPLFATPIQNMEDFRRYNFLLGFDYDIPLWDDPMAMLFRFGASAGLVIVDPMERFGTKLDSVYNFVFRPAIGLRFPVHQNVLIFTEATYDLIPERHLTGEGARIIDERPNFSTGGLWLGVAFTW